MSLMLLHQANWSGFPAFSGRVALRFSPHAYQRRVYVKETGTAGDLDSRSANRPQELPRLREARRIGRRTAASGWPLRAAGFKTWELPASTGAL